MAMRRKVVAVVEDDPDLRDAIDSLLSAYGYDTELFETAEEFLTTATKTKADCLVIDVNLPDLSGVELARHLLATGYRLPIIVTTNSGDDILRNQVIELGCLALLDKTFLAYRLIAEVEKGIGPGGHWQR
jgi:two-component system, LuxR family, response regulator FixJ